MPARVLFLGLDAAETTLIERWAREGYCPSLRSAMERGAAIRMSSSLETLPGAIWPEISFSMGCGRHAHYYHPDQLCSGEAVKRPLKAGEINAEDYFWVRASRAGQRVFVADIPQTVAAADFNGLQLFEWGTHDRNFDISSEPPSLLDDIRAKYGDHPVITCDTHGETREGYTKLLSALKRGAATKTRLYRDYMQRENWDLFTVCYTESHCTGHQFWHFLDPSHPNHDPSAPDELKNAVRDVYAELDKGVGALIEAAGPGAKIVLVASHGMALYTGGPNLLTEVLARLSLTSEGEDSAKGRFWRIMQYSSNPAIRRLRDTLKPLIGKRVIQSIRAGSGISHEPFTHSATRAAALRNNRCGAIRLNLKGREPFGEVAPGNEETALIEMIREALLELIHPATREPIVQQVHSAREAFGPDHHPDVPDIMVVFRDDLGVLDECWSERLGLVKRSVYQHWLPRTGDHTPHSTMWVVNGPFPAGARYQGGDVLDVGPAVLELLGLAPPEGNDGRSLTRLVTGAQIVPRDRRAGPRANWH
ncbi:MAG: alkaline phosphatase family protein [Beijerinckiaceae bacterium]|nr:alkaline phosphatase family protein [Beijerinckiaceae bacterium]